MGGEGAEGEGVEKTGNRGREYGGREQGPGAGAGSRGRQGLSVIRAAYSSGNMPGHIKEYGGGRGQHRTLGAPTISSM